MRLHNSMIGVPGSGTVLWSGVVCLVAVQLVDGAKSFSVNKTMLYKKKTRLGVANDTVIRPDEPDLEKKVHYHDSEMMKMVDGTKSFSVNNTMLHKKKTRLGVANDSVIRPNKAHLEKKLHYHDSEMMKMVDREKSFSVNKAMLQKKKTRLGVANDTVIRPNEADLEKKVHYHDSEMMKLWKEIASQRSIIADIERNIVLMGFQNTTNEQALGVRRNRTRYILRVYHAHKYKRDKIMKDLLVVGGPGIHQGNDSDASARLELMGVPERPKEDTLELARKYAALIGMMDIGGLVSAHRINSTSFPRPILVQLRSTEQKKTWLMLGKIGRKCVLASALDHTFPEQDVFVMNAMSDSIRRHLSLARVVAAQREVRYVWVENDTIFMQQDLYHTPIEIKDATDFDIFKGPANEVVMNQLEIVGVPERKDEDVLSLVRTIARVIGARDKGGIIAAGRYRGSLEPPRPIIAVLKTHEDHKYWLQRSGTEITAKIFHKSFPSTRITWCEHRTLDNALLTTTRVMAREMGYHSVFTRHGRIFIQKNLTSKVIEIRTIMDLRLLKAGYEKVKQDLNISAINDT